MTLQITYSAINSQQFQIMYYTKVCDKCSLSLILNKRIGLIFLITAVIPFQSLLPLNLIDFFLF